MKISKKIAFKRYCNHIVGLFSSIKVVVTKGKLPLSTIGYPYQQLVTILTKKTEAGILKTFIAIAFKKISYPLSTISYPYQQLVTLSSTISYPLLASHSTGYTSSVTGYTYPQLATLFNFKGAFLAILGNNHNQKKCLHSKGLYQKLINQFLTGYTSSVTGYTSSVTGYTYPQLATLHPQLATLLSVTGYTSSAIGYTCYSKTPTTMGKTYFLLKLLQNLFKNLVNIQEYHYGY
ncbi:hypothetical protein BTURTLESOX_630 [bacterium endosymbiont of Bathymodiolus sp. 5 South]|nr:hypothetical protein BTURTLESOX_630 [bacterium endosymbiont of Bathymodiolus sp. 5 South]VVM21992.1 hypothetical protein BSPWISOXPB_5725 [uncultured Gammaproteobacteria bacterium]